jgi:hypothetical protein
MILLHIHYTHRSWNLYSVSVGRQVRELSVLPVARQAIWLEVTRRGWINKRYVVVGSEYLTSVGCAEPIGFCCAFDFGFDFCFLLVFLAA